MAIRSRVVLLSSTYVQYTTVLTNHMRIASHYHQQKTCRHCFISVSWQVEQLYSNAFSFSIYTPALVQPYVWTVLAFQVKGREVGWARIGRRSIFLKLGI